MVIQGSWRTIATELFCELCVFRTARVVDSDRVQLSVRKVSVFGFWRDVLSMLGVLFMRIGGWISSIGCWFELLRGLQCFVVGNEGRWICIC